MNIQAFLFHRPLSPKARHGHVSIWNDSSSWSRIDLKAEEQRFRDMGVDGVIDLRNTPHPRG